MTLTGIGWIVVHSLWQGALIAGLTALCLSLLGDGRARARYVIACTGLALMAALPVITAVTGIASARWKMGPATLRAIDGAIGYPTMLWWGSVVVPVVGAAWLAGVAVQGIRIAIEARRVRQLRLLGVSDVCEAARAAAESLRASMSLPVPVAVLSSSRAAVPMMLGWARPVILLPEGADRRLPADRLRSLLAHELAHVRRADYAANVAQTVLDALLFHHPGARWMSRRVRTEREYCCDDVAIATAGNAAEYARTLAALEDARVDCHFAVAAGSGTLLDRIQRVVGQPRTVLTPVRAAIALTLASIVAAAIFAAAMIVPPSLPFGVDVRRRVGPPAGATGQTPNAPPDGVTLPRRQAR